MRSSGSLLRNLAARGLLALAFLLAQQTAALHWLSHAVESTQQKAGNGTAPDHHCDECLTLSALGAGAPSSGMALALDAAAPAPCAAPLNAPAPAALRLAFRSRAPPVLI